MRQSEKSKALLRENYILAYGHAVEELKRLSESKAMDVSYMRNQLSKDYTRMNLDPDGKAIRYVGEVKCTGDALLSLKRICEMELDVGKIVPTFEKYREDSIFYFPCENGGINSSRYSKLGDKIDYTLSDLKKFYSGEWEQCVLLSAYRKPKTAEWLEQMKSFENLVEWYGIKGVFTDYEYHVIDIETGKPIEYTSDITTPNKQWSQEYYKNLKARMDALKN